MAFDRQFLKRRGATADGLTRWKYSPPADTLSFILSTPDYFTGANDILKDGDMVILDCLDGSAETDISSTSTSTSGSVTFDQSPFLGGSGGGTGTVNLLAQQNPADVRVTPSGGGTPAIILAGTVSAAGVLSPAQALQLANLGTSASRNVGTAAGNLVELEPGGQFPASVIPGGGGGGAVSAVAGFTGNVLASQLVTALDAESNVNFLTDAERASIASGGAVSAVAGLTGNILASQLITALDAVSNINFLTDAERSSIAINSLQIAQKANGETLDLSRVNEIATGAAVIVPTTTTIGATFGAMLAEGGTTATIGAPINATLTVPLEQQNYRWDGTTWDRYGSITGGGGGGLGANTVGPTELQSTTVTPGSFTNADITVDGEGRLTAASNGTGGAATLGPTFTTSTTYSPTTHAGDFLAIDSTSGAVVLTLPDIASVPDGTNFWIRSVSDAADASIQAAVSGQIRSNNGYGAHSIGSDQVFLGLSRAGSVGSWARVWAEGGRWIIVGSIRSGSNDDLRYDSLSAIPDNLITSAKLADDVGRYGTNNNRDGTFNLVQTDENEMIIWTGAAGNICSVLDAAPGSQFVIKRDSTNDGTLQVGGATRLRFEGTSTTTFSLNAGKTVTLISRANSAPLIIDVLGGA